MKNDVSSTKLNNVKNDILASIVVFLVAIPLCLGIALASGAPLFAGIVTGVIGGIIVGLLSESPLSVSGPAAGMVAVVIATINQLGSYEAFLLALFIAGIIQIFIGVFRAGFIANFVPSTVIKGLLAAIGILIIIKQLPLAFGYYAEANSLQKALEMAQETLGFSSVFDLSTHINIGASLITLISLLILIVWEKIFHKTAKIIPPAVLVVIMAVSVNYLFQLFSPALALQSSHLVNIPVNGSLASFTSQFQHPNFHNWNNINIYIYALMIAIVASLETLLTLQAVEKIDHKHRYCSRNKELVAQGVGNAVSGLIGGLPITSVIVRSSANINAGATSKISTILHGFLLLLSASFIAKWLNYIPIAALAAILMHTGYKLARISLFKEVYKEGWRYFIPFAVTIITIVFTNLLLGIVIGLLCSVFFMLRHNSKNGFIVVDEQRPSGKILRLILPQQVTFINKAAIVEKLNQIPKDSKVIIDAKATDYIDNDILSMLVEFKSVQAVDKKIQLNLEGFKESYHIYNQTSFISATTYDVQATLTPKMILEILREGNHRFANSTPIHKNHKQHIIATSNAQHPIAVVLGCIDSRVPVEIIFDLGLGDIFVIRVAGNISNDDILGNLEFACKVAGAKLIIILGHKQCGAIKAACDGINLGHITQLIGKINPAIQPETATENNRNSNNEEFLMNVTENHMQLTKQFIYKKSNILRELIDKSDIGLINALYDVKTGKVEFNDTLVST